MSRNSGLSYFKRTFFGEDYSVHFKEWARKKVVCVIRDGLYEEKFVGIARLHPDDEWNIKTGRELAFYKALDKRLKFYKKIKKGRENAMIEFDELHNHVADGLIYRFYKLQENL